MFAEAGECWDVDFMVKFNPKSQPDKYKLSEFTQPGQRKAVIKIDTDDDYMFQVLKEKNIRLSTVLPPGGRDPMMYSYRVKL